MTVKITAEDLLQVSAKTHTRLVAFVESKRVKMQELASLSRQLLEDMGKPNNMIQDLIMMQTLRQLREDERGTYNNRFTLTPNRNE